MTEKNLMSRWELGCIVFNSLIYKMFTGYSEGFSRTGGSAAWLTAVFSGVVFLSILAIILFLFRKVFKDGSVEYAKNHKLSFISKLVRLIAIAYFSFGICYASYSACSVLKMISYTKSPPLFILFFFLAGAVISALFGEKSIRRLHSLNALGIGVTLVAISFLSLKYADIFNIFPILGKGAKSVFLKGLSTLFLYSDIIIIFFLPKKDGSYSFNKTVFFSALSAVIVNIAVVCALSLNMPYELSENLSLPIYPLTKTASLGKFPIRLDLIYQIALISSTLLYISLAFGIIFRYIKIFSIRKKSSIAAILVFALCIPLCGCYDSREVEEKAYIIALGIDKGSRHPYKYTFQISNPLESGGSIGAEEKASEESSGEDKKNKTVDNIIIESADYYSARDKLKSYLSKEPDISHIKLIVYSFDVASEDALKHSRLLLSEREIRPGTNLCLSESAEAFLTSVNPTLEESTVRYYELFFRNRDMIYSPVTELRDFVGRSCDAGYDAVIPIAEKNRLSGMGIFSNGVLTEKLSGEDVIIYKLLCGKLPPCTINGGTIKSARASKINVNIKNDAPEIELKVYITAEENISPDTITNLKNSAESFLYKTASLNCDILGIGRYEKRKSTTQNDTGSTDWNKIFHKSIFNINIFTEFVNYSQNLQKN